jgi:pSer/pThr/pTyr-binding forkhead associated (FHA) protein
MGGFGAGGYVPPVVDDFDDFDEHTTLSARRSQPAYWTLSLPNGNVELVTDRAIVIGREPQFMSALPQARLIPVPDPSRSVSKNHACFSLYGTSLVVEDLGSTNGIIVVHADGREHDIGVGGRAELEAGSRVELGDATISIGRA